VKLASPHHWGKRGETEWQMRLERHQWVFEGKDPESGACGHELKSPPACDHQVTNEYENVHGQNAIAIANANGGGSRGPSVRMSDLRSVSDRLNARNGCVHGSLHGVAKIADAH
jgi:hypothetical protein